MFKHESISANEIRRKLVPLPVYPSAAEMDWHHIFSVWCCFATGQYFSWMLVQVLSDLNQYSDKKTAKYTFYCA